jgi:hypothetical protein
MSRSDGRIRPPPWSRRLGVAARMSWMKPTTETCRGSGDEPDLISLLSWTCHRPSERAMTTFMISLEPPKIRVTRASAYICAMALSRI